MIDHEAREARRNRLAAVPKFNARMYGIPPEGWRQPTMAEQMKEDYKSKERYEFSVWYRQLIAENGWADEIRASLKAIDEEFAEAVCTLQ